MLLVKVVLKLVVVDRVVEVDLDVLKVVVVFFVVLKVVVVLALTDVVVVLLVDLAVCLIALNAVVKDPSVSLTTA